MPQQNSDTPPLPAGFKLDPVPQLPPGFKLDPVDASESSTNLSRTPETNAQRNSRGTARTLSQRKQSISLDPHYPITGTKDDLKDFAGDVLPKVAAGVGIMGLAAGGAEATAALMRGSFRPALGLAAGLTTGAVVDKGLQALGAPWWVSEIAGAASGAAVGARTGMTPESVEALKNGGLKGLVKSWLGFTKEDEALGFFKEKYGRDAVTATEKLQARAEAQAFKRQIIQSLQAKVEKLPVETQRDIAFNYYKENYGALPATAEQKIQALREMRTALKPKLDELVPKTEDPFEDTRGKVGKQLQKFGGTKSPEYGPAYGRTKPRLSDRLAPEAKTETAAEGEESDLEGKLKESIKQARYKSSPHTGSTSRELDPGKVINAEAEAKNIAMAKRFKSLKMTPEQVERMTEEEYNAHRVEENAERKAQGLSQMERPRPGVKRRSFEELKADIAREMRSK